MSFLNAAGDFIAKLTGTSAPGQAQQAQLAPPIVNYQDQINKAQNTAAPVIGQTQLAPAAQATAQQANAAQFGVDQTGRNFQTDLASRLQQQAQGNGPGLGQLAFQQNQDANIAAGQSQIAANSRGLNSGLAARNVADVTAQQNLAGANQAAQIGMQERMQANQQLGQVGSNIYGQDTQIAQQNAQLQQQAALQNAQLGTQVGLSNQAATNQFGLQQGQMSQQVNLQNAATQLQQQGLNNQQVQAYLASSNQRDIAQLGAAQSFQAQLQQRYANEQAANEKLFGGITTAVGSATGIGAIGQLGQGGVVAPAAAAKVGTH